MPKKPKLTPEQEEHDRLIDEAEARGEPHPEALEQMRKLGGNWAVYENQDLGHSMLGHKQFLKFGEGCIFLMPPTNYPADTKSGFGWRYYRIGHVDLETGKIVRMKTA